MDIVFFIFLGFAGLMLIIALITKIFPAKKPNHLYGYRTDRSMRNRRNWDYAQSLLPTMFLRIAIYHLIVSAIWYLGPIYSEKVGIFVFLAVLLASFGFEIYRNEKKLKRFSREKV